MNPEAMLQPSSPCGLCRAKSEKAFFMKHFAALPQNMKRSLLRLLIKQYGMSGNVFDLCSESTILFNTWDTLFKVK
jgi:hypothetical protein